MQKGLFKYCIMGWEHMPMHHHFHEVTIATWAFYQSLGNSFFHGWLTCQVSNSARLVLCFSLAFSWNAATVAMLVWIYGYCAPHAEYHFLLFTTPKETNKSKTFLIIAIIANNSWGLGASVFFYSNINRSWICGQSTVRHDRVFFFIFPHTFLMLMLSLVKEIMTLKLSFIKRHVQHGRTTVMAVSLCNFDDDWDVTQILALNDLLF